MLSQCPQCKTVFRVRPEQLEAANGKVRCSRCHTVFIAAEHPYRTRVEPAQQTAPVTPASEPSPRPSANDRLRSSHPFSWPEVRQKSQPVPSSTSTPAQPPPAEPGPQPVQRDTEEPAQPSGTSTPPKIPTETPTEPETQSEGSLPQELQSELSALFPDSAQAHTPSPPEPEPEPEPEPPASLTQPQEEHSTDDAAWLKYLQSPEPAPEEDAPPLSADDATVEEEPVAQQEEDETDAPWMKYIYGNDGSESDLPADADAGIQPDTSGPPPETGISATEAYADELDKQEDTEPDLAVGDDTKSALSTDDEETWWEPPHGEGATDHSEVTPETWFDDSNGSLTAPGESDEHEFFAEAEDAGPETQDWTLSDGLDTEPGSDDEDPPFTMPLDDPAIQDDEVELPLDSGDGEQTTPLQATVYDLFGGVDDENEPPLDESAPEEPEQGQEVDLWSDFALEDEAEPEPDAHLDLFTEEDEPPFAAAESGESGQQADIELWSDLVLDEEPAQEAAPHRDLFAEGDEPPITEAESETPDQGEDADLWDDLHFEEETEQEPPAPRADRFDTAADSTFAETRLEATGPADESELWTELEDEQDSVDHHPDLFAVEPDGPLSEHDSDDEDELHPESDEDSLSESYADLFAESEEFSDERDPEAPAENERESWFDSDHESPVSGEEPGAGGHEEAASGAQTGAGRPAGSDNEAHFASEGAPDASAVEPEPALTTAPGSTGKPLREGYNLPPQLAQTANHNNRAALGWGLGILLLLSTLGLQYLYYQRATLAQSDTWRPLLEQMCAITGCELPLRRDLSQVQLVEHLMQNHPRHPDSLLITATLVNRADFTQPFPLVEVVMTDLEQKVVARRRFGPEHYLVGDAAQQRFVPNTRIPLLLEVVDPGESAVGFEFHFY